MASDAELPKPKRPTRSPRWTPATRRLRKPMIPAHSNGATWEASRPAGKRDREVGANRRVLRIAAVHRVAGKYGMIAEVLHSCRQNQQSPSTPPIQETPTRVPMGRSGVAPSTTSPTI